MPVVTYHIEKGNSRSTPGGLAHEFTEPENLTATKAVVTAFKNQARVYGDFAIATEVIDGVPRNQLAFYEEGVGGAGWFIEVDFDP